MEIIKFNNVTKRYNAQKGVFDISFTINKGEIFGFLGPSGSGKTTIMRILLGFLKEDCGDISINNLDPTTKSHLINREIGFIAGEQIIPNNMSIKGYLKFYAQLRGIKDLTKMEALIKYFDLDTSGKIKKMSKGMKQKLAIITAFMGDFSIYVLDEPTSGLDPVMQNNFVKLVKKEKAAGKTILLCSHIMREVEVLCDRLTILKKGRLVHTSTLAAIHEEQKTVEEKFWECYGQDEMGELLNVF
ncbi:ABC-2 type transport system ATP-binding protein [Spiroplasma syrphidicola EA-1]|uniref:ABC-2 type transport system ATP-binding protein n=1 Tax=Spiroplasma syrphidicola EA-1 TaxID=1276229 RepID=R4UE27_9MOLU|nr:ABC transporter ATP-binding protein [Spiroplasma syrphidicola]AGM26134.1 ABC-2 type transport system ATP-binding protein [Spiroplasma syrphidicola EA-1]